MFSAFVEEENTKQTGPGTFNRPAPLDFLERTTMIIALFSGLQLILLAAATAARPIKIPPPPPPPPPASQVAQLIRD
jgi:hypothetical protein